MNYQIGQIVEGKITGIQPYGAFVLLDQSTTGLIHISEISDGYVHDINDYVRNGDIVKVKIIDFDAGMHQAKLSLKAVSHSRSRARRKPFRQKPSLPLMRIGFRSVSEKMDDWIAAAEKEILEKK